jgi:prepilin-type N-terminal cleavage/methylation domain-containing protein
MVKRADHSQTAPAGNAIAQPVFGTKGTMNTSRHWNVFGHGPLKMGQRAARGFTLVEIMIVVSIIGLLAVIAIPNFLKARNSARVKACMNNLRVMNGAKTQWAFDARQSSAAVPVTTDIAPYLRNGMPECPANGTYRIRRVSRNPSCSFWPEGHTLANLNGDDDPDAD